MYLREASLTHLTRKKTEARTQSTRDWITGRAKGNRRRRPPNGGSIRLDLRNEREELTGRCYQLLSGYTAPEAIRPTG